MTKSIKLKSGNETDLDAAKPIAHTGEPHFTTDTKRLYVFDGIDMIDVGATLTERGSDPPDPAEGRAIVWLSDGTGSGDAGDVMIKITIAGQTKTATLVDFSEL